MRIIAIGMLLYMAYEALEMDKVIAILMLVLAILFTLEGFGIGVNN
jgi:hypothetical protein